MKKIIFGIELALTITMCPYTEEDLPVIYRIIVYSIIAVLILGSTVNKDPMHLLEKQKEIKDKEKIMEI